MASGISVFWGRPSLRGTPEGSSGPQRGSRHPALQGRTRTPCTWQARFVHSAAMPRVHLESLPLTPPVCRQLKGFLSQ